MSNPGDESLNFDDLGDLDDLASLGDDMALSGLPDVDPLAGLPSAQPNGAADLLGESAPVESAATDQAVAVKDDESTDSDDDASSKKKLPPFIDWAAVGGVTAIFLLLAIFGIVSYITVIYVAAIGFVGFGFWRGRETNNIYTILLGCALIFILTAVFCLCLELAQYGFHVKAKM